MVSGGEIGTFRVKASNRSQNVPPWDQQQQLLVNARSRLPRLTVREEKKNSLSRLRFPFGRPGGCSLCNEICCGSSAALIHRPLTAETLNPEPRITTTDQVALEEPQHHLPPLLLPPAVVTVCTPPLKADFPQPAVFRLLKGNIARRASVR